MRPDAILKELTAMTRLLQAPRVLWLCGFAATLPVQGCVNDLPQVTDPAAITEEQLNTFHAGPCRAINRVRVQAGATIVELRQYQASPATNATRMLAFIAYIE